MTDIRTKKGEAEDSSRAKSTASLDTQNLIITKKQIFQCKEKKYTYGFKIKIDGFLV